MGGAALTAVEAGAAGAAGVAGVVAGGATVAGTIVCREWPPDVVVSDSGLEKIRNAR
jgi:hypothetical protein